MKYSIPLLVMSVIAAASKSIVAVIFISEVESAFLSFDSLQSNGQISHTRRGIKIGSTIDEVVAAYGRISVFPDVPDASRNIPLNELIKSYPEIYSKEDFYILFETGFVGDNVYTGLEFYTMLEANGIDFSDYLDDSEKYNKKYNLSFYYLLISFENNIVIDITVYK